LSTWEDSASPGPQGAVGIAAATIDAGAELIAFDTDFQRIARLERTILMP